MQMVLKTKKVENRKIPNLFALQDGLEPTTP